jgi:hypothetical protein
LPPGPYGAIVITDCQRVWRDTETRVRDAAGQDGSSSNDMAPAMLIRRVAHVLN